MIWLFGKTELPSDEYQYELQDIFLDNPKSKSNGIFL